MQLWCQRSPCCCEYKVSQSGILHLYQLPASNIITTQTSFICTSSLHQTLSQLRHPSSVPAPWIKHYNNLDISCIQQMCGEFTTSVQQLTFIENILTTGGVWKWGSTLRPPLPFPVWSQSATREPQSSIPSKQTICVSSQGLGIYDRCKRSWLDPDFCERALTNNSLTHSLLRLTSWGS